MDCPIKLLIIFPHDFCVGEDPTVENAFAFAEGKDDGIASKDYCIVY
jgi:hypothetical protein